MFFSSYSSHRYFLYRQPTDMRKGFDGLSGIVCNELEMDPLSGDVFIFLNRRKDRVKVLFWEGDGFSIYYKRLEAGTYELPPSGATSMVLSGQDLQLLLSGIQLSSVKRRKRFDGTPLDGTPFTRKNASNS
jgi:transposase